MRIMHTADWHLGRSLHGVDLFAAHEQFFAHLVDLVRDQRPDALIVAGDVYDHVRPADRSMEMLQHVWAQLVELTHVIAIPGNHDSAALLGFGADLLPEKLSIVARIDQIGQPVVVRERSGEPAGYVYPIPYLYPDAARYRLRSGADDDPLARSHEAVMTAALRRVQTDLDNRPPLPTVGLIHAFVKGASTTDSERDISVGGAQEIPTHVFDLTGATGGAQCTPDTEQTQVVAQPGHAATDNKGQTAGHARGEGHKMGGVRGFDYVAAGHLHRPQNLALPSGAVVRYSGSPTALSFLEADHCKSTTIVDFSNCAKTGAPPRLEMVENPVYRRLVRLEATLDQVLGDTRISAHRDDWVELTLTDLTFDPNTLSKVRTVLPNLLVLTRQMPQSEHDQTRLDVRKLNQIDLLTAFFETASGQDLDATTKRVLVDQWEKVRDQP